MAKTRTWQTTDGLSKHSTAMGNNEGVYLIIDVDIFSLNRKVIYVGRSLNLSSRWKSHEIYLTALNDGHTPGVKWKVCNNSAQLEQQLIKRFKPKYNKQFK